MKSITLLVLPILLVLETTIAVNLRTTLRAVQPGDIVDTFKLQSPPSTNTCPKTIQHTSYNQTNNPLVFIVPHDYILQDSVACNNFSYMTLVKDEAVLNSGLIGDEEADARDNIGKFLKNSSLISGEGQKLTDDGVEWWALMEFQTRVCENERRFRVGTVGMLIKEADEDLEIDGVGTLEGGNKYMVIKDDDTERICVYEGEGGVDGEVAKPQNSASPTPVPSRVPGESPPAVDENGNIVGVAGEAGDDDEEEEEEEASGSPDDDSEDDDDDEDDEDDAVCFPGDVEVEIEGGSVKFMKDVAIGDKVRVGVNEYSEVFMFTHKIENGEFDFVKIDTELGNQLYLSKGHYLYVNGQLAAAETVVPGDDLHLGNGMTTKVVTTSSEYRQGLYNPQTIHGDIIANGILASTYTTAVAPSVAHKLLIPVRAIYSWFGIASSALEKGGGIFTRYMPRGAPVIA